VGVARVGWMCRWLWRSSVVDGGGIRSSRSRRIRSRAPDSTATPVSAAGDAVAGAGAIAGVGVGAVARHCCGSWCGVEVFGKIQERPTSHRRS